MGTHEASKSHLVQAIIVGWVLATLIWLIFSFLAQNYVTYIPMLAAYAVWTVVSLMLYGRGLDKEMAAAGESH
jgi:multidrug transporter EmrE-like cation transporter